MQQSAVAFQSSVVTPLGAPFSTPADSKSPAFTCRVPTRATMCRCLGSLHTRSLCNHIPQMHDARALGVYRRPAQVAATDLIVGRHSTHAFRFASHALIPCPPCVQASVATVLPQQLRCPGVEWYTHCPRPIGGGSAVAATPSH